MGRVAAAAHAAEVVQFQVFGNLPHGPYVGHPMGFYLPTVKAESPVALRQPSRPHPARAEVGCVDRNGGVLVDKRPEPLLGSSVPVKELDGRITELRPALVVLAAQAFGDSGTATRS